MVFFCSHAAFWHWFSVSFFLFFDLMFSQWKFFELYVRTCPAMFFLLRITDFCFVLPWLLGIDFFNDLPHSKKMTSELTYGTLNFMNIYLLEVNSMHLSSGKHICPNFWLLVLSFWFRILILGSSPFVPPVRYAPPVTEHVPLHSKSLCKKYCTCIWGVQIICAHWAEGEQTEKILILKSPIGAFFF